MQAVEEYRLAREMETAGHVSLMGVELHLSRQIFWHVKVIFWHVARSISLKTLLRSVLQYRLASTLPLDSYNIPSLISLTLWPGVCATN
jgi:hypothetical protein